MAVKLLNELNELEKLSLISMSYSRIDQFFNWCEAKYFYQYIAKAEQLSGAAALLGNVVHSVLEERLEKDVPIEPSIYDGLVEEFKDQLEAWDSDHIITDNMIEDGIVMLQEFVDRHTGDIFPIQAKEHKFEIVVGPALITGYIDRIDIQGNRLHFTDYKTGKKEVAAKNIAENLQLGIYAMALNHMYPDYEIYGELYYLRSGRQKGHLFSQSDLVAIEEKLIEMIDKIINTTLFEPTANERLCSFCDYAVTGLCRIGSQRIRYR